MSAAQTAWNILWTPQGVPRHSGGQPLHLIYSLKSAGEILRVVEAFLAQRFERFRGLRSLEVPRSLPSITPPKEAPCPN